MSQLVQATNKPSFRLLLLGGTFKLVLQISSSFFVEWRITYGDKESLVKSLGKGLE